jgi:predicted enzyme related to lactoylglutathione lyase
VTQLGGEVVGRRIPVGAGHAAYFTDPSGNLVALYEERKPG